MFKDVIIDNKIDDIYQIVISGDEKYLSFTYFDSPSKSWTLCVTNGIDVWRLVMAEEDFNTHRELANISTEEAFCLKIRHGFVSGDLSIVLMGTRLKLSIGKGDTGINFDLFEAKAVDKKTDLKTVLFQLAETSIKMETKLKIANQTIDKLQSESSKKGPSGFLDSGTGSKRGANASKAKPKKVGMSVVNPNSKKRKVATGVVFE
ncbi:hypothetical protein SNE40_009348 [Patella caerulea]|uniref:Uncharacterized protein n=1 Tax=Patella caerulea TaxID=87958 RepID=A0AAN8PY91_PATCE